MTIEEDLDKVIRREKYFDEVGGSILRLSTIVLKDKHCKHFNKNCPSCVAHIKDDDGGVCALEGMMKRWI